MSHTPGPAADQEPRRARSVYPQTVVATGTGKLEAGSREGRGLSGDPLRQGFLAEEVELNFLRGT